MINELIESALKNKPDKYCFMEIAEYIDGSCAWVEDHGFKKFWYKWWLCTHDQVGVAVYTLNDKPICISTQYGRKDSRSFYWLSMECYSEARQHVIERLGDPYEAFRIVVTEKDIEQINEELKYYTND